MDLVNEQKHISRFPHLVQHIFDPFLKFSPVFGTGHHAGKVQDHHPLSTDGIRHIPGCDHLGQALGHRRLSHARLSDEAGVIFRPAA